MGVFETLVQESIHLRELNLPRLDKLAYEFRFGLIFTAPRQIIMGHFLKTLAQVKD